MPIINPLNITLLSGNLTGESTQLEIDTVPPGESLNSSFVKINDNFANIWAAGPVNSNIQIVNNTVYTTDTNGNLVLNPNGIGSVIANAHVIPDTANIRDLGTNTLRWRDLYVQYANVSGNIDISGDYTIGGNLSVGGYLKVTGNIIEVGNIITDSLTIQLANTAANVSSANGAGITVGANDDIATWLYDSTANAWTTNIGVTATGNIGGLYIFGNAAYMTGLPEGYGNANVAVFLDDFGSNNISTAGNITANTFIGDGSQLTGISSYSNANVEAYLPTYTGDLGNVGNITSSGNIETGNLVVGDNFYIGNTLFTRTITVGRDTTPVTVPLASNNSFNVLTSTGNVTVYTT